MQNKQGAGTIEESVRRKSHTRRLAKTSRKSNKEKPLNVKTEIIRHFFSWWTEFVRKNAVWVLVTVVLLSLGAGSYAALRFKINVDAAAMFPDDLPQRVVTREFFEQFPMLKDTMLIVVEAPTPTLAQVAALQLSQQLRKNEGQTFHTIFAPGADPFMNRLAFLMQPVDQLEDVADHLARVQPYVGALNQDPSLRGVLHVLDLTIREGGDAVFEQKEFGALLLAIREVVDGVVEDSPKVLAWDDLLGGRTSTKAERRQFVVVQPVLNHDLMRPATAAIEAVYREAEALGLTEDNGYRVRLTGDIALLHDDVNAILGAGMQSNLISFVLVAAMVWYAMRSARMFSAVIASLCVGFLLTTAFAVFAIGELDIISMTYGALVIGLGVDFGIHFGMRYWEHLDGGKGHTKALAATGEDLGVPLLLCAATTGIGFLSFQVTDYIGVANLGLICAAGIMICLFCSVTVIPAILTIWPVRLPPLMHAESKFQHKILSLPSQHSRKICWTFAALGCLAAALLPRVYFDYNPLSLRDQRAESVRTFFELIDEEGGVLWSVSGVESNPEVARQKAVELRKLDSVKSAFTIHDLIPEDQDEKLAILEDIALFMPPPPSDTERHPAPTVDEDAAAIHQFVQSLEVVQREHAEDPKFESARQLYTSLSRLDQRLSESSDRVPMVRMLRDHLSRPVPIFLDRLYAALTPGKITLADIPEELRQRMITPDGQYRIEVYPRGNLQNNAALLQFSKQVKTVLPSEVGMVPELIESGNTIVRSFRAACMAAVVVMVFVVFAIWRRVLDTVYVMLALLLGSLFTCATMALVGLSFNYANVVMLPLMLGIGVDTGIHLVQRYRTEGLRGAELLGSSTTKAVLWSSLTTIAGFGSLATAHHMGMATLGRLLSIGILWMLICNLIFLPALLERQSAADGSEKRR